MSWLAYLLLAALAFLGLLAGPLICGRLFLPRLTLALVRGLGHWVEAALNRLRPGLDLRLLVKAGNRYFRRAFAAAPYAQRVIFLPFCLRPLDCPAGVDPNQGLLCQGDCPDCRLGDIRREALELGYARVYIVPSSRLLKGRGLLPGDQFISSKLKEHAPAAALGVVCARYLRERLLTGHRVGSKGYAAAGGGPGSALQGVLLEAKSCRNARVDWDLLRSRMLLKSS